MPIIRLILLLGIAGTLLLFALQNWTPSMQLVFLGIRSPAFPLALWVLGAIAAGIFTALVIAGLFRLTGFTAQRQVRGRKPASFAQNPANRSAYQPPRETERTQTRTTWQAKPPSASVRQDEDGSDWEDDASDWFDDEAEDRPKTWEPDTRQRADYQAETRSEPGAAKPESVVDADFRVIVPPYRNLDRNPNDDDFDQ